MASIFTVQRLQRLQYSVRLLSFCLAASFLLLSLPPAATAADKTRYTFAIVPQFPPSIIKRDWTPLIKMISRAAGIRLELKFYRSIPEFEEDFLRGGPDFVYLNPYHAVMAKKTGGYIPIIRDGENRLFGILVVRHDAAIASVQDLDGREIAFPSPNSFAASLYMQALLSEKEKIRFTARYLKTHSNVYRHVVLRKAAAGGGVNKTLNKETPDLQALLREIYRTPPVAPHPICVHPRVAVSVRDAVANAILRIGNDSRGKQLLKTVEIDLPVAADYEQDYRMLEQLGLERFVVKGEH